MNFRFACKSLRADADRIASWLPLGAYFVREGKTYRLDRDPPPGDQRRPSPAPVPEALALDAIRAGAPTRRDGDLFGGAA